MRKALGIVLGVMFLAVAIGGPAEAHIKAYKTTIIINHANTTSIIGYVGPQQRPDACYQLREVTLSTTDGNPVGTTYSSDTGYYQFNGPFGGLTDYTASVRKLPIRRGGGHRHYCKPASATRQTAAI